ncbi:MAG: hypothetical protein QOE32_4535 [Pseudonocardiales bacterium]|jgi:hypothetical protein|nr:hypothetical protein [Pseudonocardiales bacterium]
MRADAIRNLDSGLQTDARLLAQDPRTSMATIAAETGVHRRTFTAASPAATPYSGRRIPHQARCDEVFPRTRLEDAPVAVAMHR